LVLRGNVQVRGVLNKKLHPNLIRGTDKPRRFVFQLTKELELKLEERHSHVTICGPAFQKSLEEDEDEDW